jgi:hypothetical protein
MFRKILNHRLILGAVAALLVSSAAAAHAAIEIKMNGISIGSTASMPPPLVALQASDTQGTVTANIRATQTYSGAVVAQAQSTTIELTNIGAATSVTFDIIFDYDNAAGLPFPGPALFRLSASSSLAELGTDATLTSNLVTIPAPFVAFGTLPLGPITITGNADPQSPTIAGSPDTAGLGIPVFSPFTITQHIVVNLGVGTGVNPSELNFVATSRLSTDPQDLELFPEPGSMLIWAGMGLAMGYGAMRRRKKLA